MRNKAVYLAIGVTCAGRKEVLGLWIEQTEGAKFWLSVMNELKTRGVADVLIAVVDGLKGFPDAIEAVFPQATVQTCIVHLIRRSLAYASYKERRPLAAALKTIYRAPTAAAAEAALDALEAGPWGEKYPAIVKSWRSAWEHVVPFLAFSQPIRRAICTTNAIESLNSTVRRAVRTRGHFPNGPDTEFLTLLPGRVFHGPSTGAVPSTNRAPVGRRWKTRSRFSPRAFGTRSPPAPGRSRAHGQPGDHIAWPDAPESPRALNRAMFVPRAPTATSPAARDRETPAAGPCPCCSLAAKLALRGTPLWRPVRHRARTTAGGAKPRPYTPTSAGCDTGLIIPCLTASSVSSTSLETLSFSKMR